MFVAMPPISKLVIPRQFFFHLTENIRLTPLQKNWILRLVGIETNLLITRVSCHNLAVHTCCEGLVVDEN